VLFSRDDVAQFINRHFEAVWESVRPVPVVRIDFGNGTVLTRTLHGNIATYVCAADGQVLDVLPGIYAAQPYVDRLAQLRLLANWADQKGKEQRDARLGEYHEGQLKALEEKKASPQFVNIADFSKMKIEGGVKAVLVAGNPARGAAASTLAGAKLKQNEETPGADDVGHWKVLTDDTEVNETERRRHIHAKLSSGALRPAKLTKWLYKEVLHADLDDPYLGLGKTLFADYPFAREDQGR
jgi:hypothetical protein